MDSQNKDLKGTLSLGIANQNNGVGKTTIASLICNNWFFRDIASVYGIDCDEYQSSWFMTRAREYEIWKINHDHGRAEQEPERFPIGAAKANKLSQYLIQEVMGRYNVAVIDFSGATFNTDMIPSLTIVDMILVPFHLSDQVLDSTEQFMQFIKNEIIPARVKQGLPKPKVYGLLNIISESSMEFKDSFSNEKEGMKIIENKIGFPILKNHISYSKPDFFRKASSDNKHHSRSTDFDIIGDEIYKLLMS